jgi:shikimate dehydrogenase
MRAIKSLGIAGANVTFPHKEEVVGYIDRLDKTAEITGAVNTIKHVNGRLIGYNTDIVGIRATISDRLKLNLQEKSIVILGAGGAARACLQVLIKEKPARITILNRNIKNAEKMIRAIKIVKNRPEMIVSSLDKIGSLDKKYKIDLLVNATSAGDRTVGKIIRSMHRHRLLKSTRFFDLNYGNRAFREKLPDGISKFEDGLYMLAVQAAGSFKIWTGIELDSKLVYRLLKRKTERIL